MQLLDRSLDEHAMTASAYARIVCIADRIKNGGPYRCLIRWAWKCTESKRLQFSSVQFILIW